MSFPFAEGGNAANFTIPYRTQSLSYYSDLRRQTTLSVEIQEFSKVAKVTVDEKVIRLMHLAQLMPLTFPGSLGFDMFGPIRKPANDVFIHWEVAGLLALVHFNERNTSVLPELATLFSNCNVHFTMDMMDTQGSPIVASEQYYKAATQANTLASPQPGGVIGSIFSIDTQPLATLTGAYQVPQISPGSSSSLFESKDDTPLFGRTVPTNAAHAAATVEILRFWNVTHVGCLFPINEYGSAFVKDFQSLATEGGVKVEMSGYKTKDINSITDAVRFIQDRDVRYVMGITQPDSVQHLFGASYDAGMVGDDYVWILPQFNIEKSLLRNSDNEKIASVLQGAALVDIAVAPNAPFLRAMLDIRTDVELRDFYVNSHTESFIFDDFLWNESIPIITTFSYTTYDAVMAMGVAACRVEEDDFTGQQLFDEFKQVKFRGVSGQVAFSDTGTRRYEGLKYSVTNILLDKELATNETIVLQSQVTFMVDFSSETTVLHLAPFRFHSGSTIAPNPLPEFDEELNLIKLGPRVFCLILSSVALLLAIGFAMFTYKYRHKTLIRAAQPLFLGMLCVGCIILASAVIPMSMQEPMPQDALNLACMSVPWLLSIGFSMAFSALLSKAYRIFKLFSFGAGMKRATLHSRDVLWIPCTLLSINVSALIAWTVVGPLKWQRVVANRDFFGRSVESYGACRASNDTSVWFMAAILFFNFCTIAFANYQTYISRHVPSDFNEAYYIALTMASLLELFLIGMPILFVVSDHPEQDFVVRTIMVFCCCCAILGPIFVPKLRVSSGAPRNGDGSTLGWKTYHSSKEKPLGKRGSNGGSSGGMHVSDEPRSNHLQVEEYRGKRGVEVDMNTFHRKTSHAPLGNGTVAEIRANVARKQRALNNLSEESDDGSKGDAIGFSCVRRQTSGCSVASYQSSASRHTRSRSDSDELFRDETEGLSRNSNHASRKERGKFDRSRSNDSLQSSIESFQSSFAPTGAVETTDIEQYSNPMGDNKSLKSTIESFQGAFTPIEHSLPYSSVR